MRCLLVAVGAIDLKLRADESLVRVSRSCSAVSRPVIVDDIMRSSLSYVCYMPRAGCKSWCSNHLFFLRTCVLWSSILSGNMLHMLSSFQLCLYITMFLTI
jgi:hypothetical protein